MTDLIQINRAIDGTLTVSSEQIAEGAGVEHASVLKLLDTYPGDFEELGQVRFEIRPGYNNAKVRIALLNEPQTSLLMTYQRNTEQVRRFKSALVKAFYKMNQQPLTEIEVAKRWLAALEDKEAAERRVLELTGPAAERDFYRSTEGLQLVGDVANRFIAYAKDRYPAVKVTHNLVRDHAARLEIIIRGNTVRNNQPTSLAIRSGWATASESTHETNTRGTIRKVTARLTVKGEARLWDGLIAHIERHGDLVIRKELAV